MSPTNYKDPVVGDIELNFSSKARYLRLSVSAYGKVVLTIPKGMSNQKKSALDFVKNNRKWIIKNLKTRTFNTYQLEEGSMIGRFQLEVLPKKAASFNCLVKEDGKQIVCYVPIDWQSQKFSHEYQNKLKVAVKKSLKDFATPILTKKAINLANKFNVSLNKIRIKTQKTRWGSFSRKNNLNLNAQLITLPEPLIDHVIIHELAHSVHLNHGPKFKKLLLKWDPYTKDRRQKLKKYSLL